MAREVVWTRKAIEDRKAILLYWIQKTKSKAYSIKLNTLFIKSTNLLAKEPYIGRKTDEKNIRVKIVRNYLVFYDVKPSQIILLTIWDSRRDTKKLTLE